MSRRHLRAMEVPFSRLVVPQRRAMLQYALLLAGRSAYAMFVPNALRTEVADVKQQARMIAYVGSRTTKERGAHGDGINVYQMNPATGSWEHLQTVSNLVNPSFLALGHLGKTLYAVHGDQSEISSLVMDENLGRLTFLNRVSTGGRNPVHLALDPTGRFMIVANYATGSVSSLAVGSDGALGALVHVLTLPGSPGPHKTQQDSSHPHHIVFDPAGTTIFVPDKGLDRIFALKLDSGGRLSLADLGSTVTREGAGPRHIVFHPSKPYAYVVNELDSSVTTYAFEPKPGTLHPLEIHSTLPSTFTGNNSAAEVAISASGKFLYVSNRGHDSIATFQVNNENSLLSPLVWTPSLGKGPRFFALNAANRFLYVANENSDTISIFHVNNTSGGLSPTGQMINTGSPVCIVFFEEDRRKAP